jgi:adenosine deaminase
LTARTFGFTEQDLKDIIIMRFKSAFISHKDKVGFLDRVLRLLRKQRTPF